jgi:4-hydroxybutyryl-CoA dehydratase/vinylacetyl-CoA-Delta-isomerase
MTDAKGDRSQRPHAQANPDAYVRIVERRADGIVISGAKAIVTGGPYMHELLVMPCRAMSEADADYAVCCAVPVDAPGLTQVARPAGRPGEAAASFSNRYGQSTSVCLFDRVFVPWERVFLAGEWRLGAEITYAYATHHRHTCIAARAGYGDLLIGAGTLMTEANGLDTEARPRPARGDDRAHHHRRGLLRLRRRRLGVCHAGSRRHRHARARCSPTSASCCWRRRSTTCSGWRTKFRAA